MTEKSKKEMADRPLAASRNAPLNESVNAPMDHSVNAPSNSSKGKTVSSKLTADD